MRRLRERAALALNGAEGEPGRVDLVDLPDTALLELLRHPLKTGKDDVVYEITDVIRARVRSRREAVKPAQTPAKVREEKFPVEVRARALRMKSNGATRAEIVAMLRAAGCEPSKSMAGQLETKYLARWRLQADVLAILKMGDHD